MIERTHLIDLNERDGDPARGVGARRAGTTTKTRKAWTIVLTIALAAPSPVKAAGPELDASKEHFRRGVELFDRNEFPAALEEFEAAYALNRLPRLLYNIARAHEGSSHYVEAFTMFERYLEEVGAKIPPENQRYIDAALPVLRARIAEVTVRVTPEGATVRIDGKDVGRSPLSKPIRLNPGLHKISASFEDHEDTERELSVAESDRVVVDLSLAPFVLPPGVRGARARLAEGLAKYARRDYRGALAALSAADDVLKSPASGLALARAHEALGQLIAARDIARRAANASKDSAEPAATLQARREAAEFLEQLAVRIPRITLAVSGVRPGVSISAVVDGTSIRPQAMGQPIEVNPGGHQVVVAAPGMKTVRRNLQVEERETTRVHVMLMEDAPDSAAPAWAWAAGSAGIMALLVGVEFAVDYARTEEILNDNCPNRKCTKEELKREPTKTLLQGLADRRNRDLLSLIGFGAVGATALGVAAVGLSSVPSSDSGSTGALRGAATLWGHRYGGGVLVSGEF